MKKNSLGRNMFIAINNILLFVTVCAAIYPILYVLNASLSSPNALMAHKGLLLFPDGFDMSAYKAVMRNKLIFRGYLNTIIVVVGGVSVNMIATIIAAYFFTRKNVMHQKFFMSMIVFTMFFSGGLIPTYLVIRGIGLENNLLSLILPGAINTTNMIILRTAFFAVPPSLEESAKIDGASHFVLLKDILIPLATPTLAVLTLYYAVGHWNSWFNASIYIRDKTLQPLQLILREILIDNDVASMDADSSIADKAMISETIKYAVIVVSTLPILCLYPFLQKFFVKGVMVGAVKG